MSQIGKLYNFKNVKNYTSRAIFDILDTCNISLRIFRFFEMNAKYLSR